MSKLEACKALLNGFILELTEETIEDLHDQYQLRHDSTLTLKLYRNRELRANILNKLLASEYSYLFIDLSNEEIARLVGLPPKDFSSYSNAINRKLSALLIKGKREELIDMKHSMEELEFVSKSDDLNHPDD